MPDVLLKLHDDSGQTISLGGLQSHKFKPERAAFGPTHHRAIDFHGAIIVG